MSEAVRQQKEVQKESRKVRQTAIASLYYEMRNTEEYHGHNAVLAAIRKWLDKPARGEFK